MRRYVIKTLGTHTFLVSNSGPRSAVGRTPYSVWPHTFVSPSADSRGAVISYWRKYVLEVLVNHLGGLSLPRKSVVKLTDRPDMTLDVYRGNKTTQQQQQGDMRVKALKLLTSQRAFGAKSYRRRCDVLTSYRR